MLATGLPFETVAGFTIAQFHAVRRAMRRDWELRASINGFAKFVGSESQSQDDTAALEARVKSMKKATGRKSFDLWEIVK